MLKFLQFTRYIKRGVGLSRRFYPDGLLTKRLGDLSIRAIRERVFFFGDRSRDYGIFGERKKKRMRRIQRNIYALR